MLALAMITTGVLQIPLAFAAVQNGCTANPHDINSGPTGDPHDFGEHGNPMMFQDYIIKNLPITVLVPNKIGKFQQILSYTFLYW